MGMTNKTKYPIQERPKDKGCIEVIHNRVNNLKNISVSIPRNKLTVVTGVSGSGKSSLAFDTLYAEGQRRYVDSLSSYARQFLDRMPKPDCDAILYIPPAVAIQQRVISRNPRSTVGTSTELYNYLKVLFSRFGKTFSPISGREVKKHTIADFVSATKQLPEGCKIFVLSPIPDLTNRTFQEQIQLYQSAGYSRLFRSGEFFRISDLLSGSTPLVLSPQKTNPKNKPYYLLIDRLSARPSDNEFLTRLADSAENAFYEGNGEALLGIESSEGTQFIPFSIRFEEDGITFEEPSPELFDFNSPTGACPTCEGFGKTIGISEDLVIPFPNLSLYEDAVACWIGPMSSTWKEDFIKKASKYHFPIHTPYEKLSDKEKDLLWHGDNKEDTKAKKSYSEKVLYGIDDYFAMMRSEYYKVQNRVRIAHFSGRTLCPDCKGRRLKKEALYVRYHGKNLADLVAMPIKRLREFFLSLDLDEQEAKSSERILLEIRNRLEVLCEVGLDYLTLNRASNTLSGGESQRINLATRLGSKLYGTLYVLDEPSIGLHERDSKRLLQVMMQLRDAGNTLVVVEHDETIMRHADLLIDIGPNAGRQGGEVVYIGSPLSLTSSTPGHTAAFLTGKAQIPIPSQRRKGKTAIEVQNACLNNLKDLSVHFPLNCLTVVTGVSGSGKSSLVRDILYKEIKAYYDNPQKQESTQHIGGDLKRIKAVEFVDQNATGRSSRSNPVTFIGAYDAIRNLYSEQPLARQMGFQPRHFSFNVEGGRCETCKGEGVITIEMQFMADLQLTCNECEGKRFRREILEVSYHGVNIYDLLEMTINQAVEFFEKYPSPPHTDKAIEGLQALQKVGLGYLKLGQNTSSLSGGEVQRLKIASFLSATSLEPTLFIFDEPTTGLHFHDIATLLNCFESLLNEGHTIIVVEHNLEIIKCADHIIDLGPEGGEEGGHLLIEGTPEEVAQCTASYTGHYLKAKLHPEHGK